MTSTLLQTAPSLTVPPTQNTAPVLEFGCLYTHDIRRKAKRWQDGFLRYHTFNKRIMVYDVPGNFIGDFHWQQGDDLQEGDEVTLENCILVQVSEARGRTETDLSVLFQKKGKCSSAKEQVAGHQGTVRSSNIGVHSQLQPKSLNAVLGTPRGPYGRTNLPYESPFDNRQNEGAEDWQSGPEPKRQKTMDTPPQPWAVVKTSKVTKSAHKDEAPLWARTADARLKRPAQNSVKAKAIPKTPSQARLAVKEVIDISSDVEERSEEVIVKNLQSRNEIANEQSRSAPGNGQSKSPSMPLQLNANGGNAKTEPVVAEPARPPRSRRRHTNAAPAINTANLLRPPKAKAKVQERLAPSSPPVSTTSRHTNVQSPIETPGNGPPKQTDSHGMSPPPQGAKTLRLAPRAPRKMLLCQSLPPSKPLYATNVDLAVGPRLGKRDAPYSRPPAQPPPEEEEEGDYLSRFRKAQQERIQARMAGKKQKVSVYVDPDASLSQTRGEVDAGTQEGRPYDKVAYARTTDLLDTCRIVSKSSKSATTQSSSAEKSKTISKSAMSSSHVDNVSHHEAMALDIGRMDEQLLNTSFTHRAKANPSLKASNVVKRIAGIQEQHEAGLPPADPPDNLTMPAQPTVAPDTRADTHEPSERQTTTTTTTNTANRAFRRVRSENDASLPLTKQPSPSLVPAAAAATSLNPATKREFQRSASLILPGKGTNSTTANSKLKPFNPAELLKEKEVVKDTDLGPWSREALDLFDWRPPNRDENLVLV